MASKSQQISHELAKAVARYHAGCLRVIGAQNVALRDVRTAKKAALCVDLGQLSEEERVASGRHQAITAPPKPPKNAPEEILAEHEVRHRTWERLRELCAKAAVEAHTKEVVYGAPLLCGYLNKTRGRSMEPVLAPLFMHAVTLQVDSDGSVVIAATDEPPRFNTVLWKDGIKAEDVAQIVNLGIDAQADLAAGWDSERIARLLTAAASVWPSLEVAEPDGTLGPWPTLPAAPDRPDEPSLSLRNGGVLFLANRASPYLLADLETVAADPANVVVADHPLQVLLEPPSTEDRPESYAPSIDEVVYPFPSNAAQRQVAEALEKNRLVVVQGPPGNGKSLTIANLVAHLVAQGKSVLVSSHKPQALTVVRDKLAESEQRFLYASLIGDGAAAKRELQRQIADVKAFAAAANRSSLTRQLKEIEERRSANGDRYRKLRDQFIDDSEPDQEDAASRWEDFVGRPTLPPSDSPLNSEQQSAAADVLRRLDAIAREHVSVWGRLRKSEIAGLTSLDGQQQTLATFIDHQAARVLAGTDARVGALVATFHPVTDAQPAQIPKAKKACEDIRAALVPVHDGRDERDAAFRLADAPQLLSDVVNGAGALETTFSEARQLAEHRDYVSTEPARRQQVVAQHALLPLMFKKRSARKWLDEHAPGAAGLTAEQVAQWSAFWESWSRLRTAADGLAGGLRAEIPKSFDPDAAQQLIARAQHAISHAQAIKAVRMAAQRTRVPLPVDEALGAACRKDLDAAILAWESALDACEADREGNALKEHQTLAFLGGDAGMVDDLLDAGDHESADSGLDELRRILAALPALQERRKLLDGPLAEIPAAAEDVETRAESGDDPPAWFREVEAALAVHESVVRFNEVAGERGTRDIAEELSSLVDDVLTDARRYLGLRIQERILDGFRKPSFLASLETFRKAISSSAKRVERFEELKHSKHFDIDVLTDVFPCWIMRPEDACRVFPLRADVFDVLIIDEASQCNPDQALPLFARARHAVIVGDDKQLSNEDLRRSLSGDANRTLIRQAGLDDLDPAGLFDQTRHSLLELVSRRQQAAVLLNEHFRCRPELIAFSNARFYGNTLTVIRDRQDDRGLGPPLLVRQVNISDPIPTARGAKVNYTEAAALLEDLQHRLADPRYEDMTFGVLSLFREQVEYLETQIERLIEADVREHRQLICSTVDGFQGDERDVILYSWRYTEVDHPAVFAFTNGGSGEQRTNVALTRAKHQAVHFVSLPIEQFPLSAGNITGYLRHAIDPDVMLNDAEARAHREPAGRSRRQLIDALTGDGLDVIENYVACGVSVDLVARDPESLRRVAVFVDAERDMHRPPDTLERIDQQALLERAGWKVVRVSATEVLSKTQASVQAIREVLPTAPAVAASFSDGENRTLVVVDATGVPIPEDMLDLESEITPEDRADYHWEVPSVEARLAAGESVFMSQFEADLYSAISRVGEEDLKVVPQWPSRNKQIDLVVTDRQGRRVAVEADGAQHHQTQTGEYIPEDLERQDLLEEAGWSFCRVDHHAFGGDPEREVKRVLDALANQPANPGLAGLVWGDGIVAEALSVPPGVAPLTPSQEPSPHLAEQPPGAAGPPTTAPAEAPNPPATSTAPSSTRDPTGVSAEAVSAFDDVPLAQVAMLVTGLVQNLGEVVDEQLPALFSEHTGVQLLQKEERTVRRFAWTAKGKKWLTFDDEMWRPGPTEPMIDEAWGDWTMTKIVDRARQMLAHEQDPFGLLLAEAYAGARTPKLAMSLVGTAINRAKRIDDR